MPDPPNGNDKYVRWREFEDFREDQRHFNRLVVGTLVVAVIGVLFREFIESWGVPGLFILAARLLEGGELIVR